MSTLKEKIEIMQRFEDGETVEWHRRGAIDPMWKEVTDPAWDWASNEYRVKKAMKTIQLFAWFTGHNLCYGVAGDTFGYHQNGYLRVPKEDMLIEVPVQVFTTSIKGD